MNKDELRGEIVRHGETNSILAEALGITPRAFSNKINGDYGFTQKEIQAIIDRYKLSAKSVMLIFFTPSAS